MATISEIKNQLAKLRIVKHKDPIYASDLKDLAPIFENIRDYILTTPLANCLTDSDKTNLKDKVAKFSQYKPFFGHGEILKLMYHNLANDIVETFYDLVEGKIIPCISSKTLLKQFLFKFDESEDYPRTRKLTIDQNDNIYLGGTLDYPPIFSLLKVNRNYHLIWWYFYKFTKKDFTPELLSKILVDENGYIYILGQYYVDDYYNIIFKLDNNGNILWCIRFSFGVPDPAWYMNFDKDGNIIIVGEGRTVTWSYIIKIDRDGNILWCKKYYLLDAVFLFRVDVDSENNIIVNGGARRVSPLEEYEIVLKLDENGNPIKCLGLDKGRLGLKVDPSDNIYLYSYYTTYDGEPKWSRVVLIKFDNDLNFLWIKGLWDGVTTGIYGTTHDLSIDKNNNIIFPYESRKYDGAVISKLDENGNMLWSRKIGKTKLESIIASSTAIDSQDFIHCCGVNSWLARIKVTGEIKTCNEIYPVTITTTSETLSITDLTTQVSSTTYTPTKQTLNLIKEEVEPIIKWIC